jgi:hypothetical protein
MQVIDLETELRRYGDALEGLMMAGAPVAWESRSAHRRRWIAVIAAAALVLVVVGGLWFTNRATSRGVPVSTDQPPKLSILDRARRPTDVLPPPFGVDPVIARPLRRALAVPGWQIFIGPGLQPGDDYCVDVVSVLDTKSRGGRSAQSGCGNLASIARDGAHIMGVQEDAHRTTFFGVVLDGTESVTVAGVKAVLGENAFIAKHIDWTGPITVRVRTRTGTRDFVVPAPTRPPPSSTTTP